MTESKATRVTLPEMLSQWLKEHGYDGLCSDRYECGCLVGDLMPCGEPSEHCAAGYKGPPNEDGGAWAIYPTAKAREAAIAKAKGTQ